jgi:hypothetical protein
MPYKLASAHQFYESQSSNNLESHKFEACQLSASKFFALNFIWQLREKIALLFVDSLPIKV